MNIVRTLISPRGAVFLLLAVLLVAPKGIFVRKAAVA